MCLLLALLPFYFVSFRFVSFRSNHVISFLCVVSLSLSRLVNVPVDELSGHSTEFDAENVSWLVCLNAHNTPRRDASNESIERERNEVPRSAKNPDGRDCYTTLDNATRNPFGYHPTDCCAFPCEFSSLRTASSFRSLPRQQSTGLESFPTRVFIRNLSACSELCLILASHGFLQFWFSSVFSFFCFFSFFSFFSLFRSRKTLEIRRIDSMARTTSLGRS